MPAKIIKRLPEFNTRVSNVSSVFMTYNEVFYEDSPNDPPTYELELSDNNGMIVTSFQIYPSELESWGNFLLKNAIIFQEMLSRKVTKNENS